MNKQAAAVIVVAFVLFTVAFVGALALTGGDSDAVDVHPMPNGQMMSGSEHSDSMTGHMKSNGRTTTGPMHTMSRGEQMPGMTHSSR